MNHTRTTAGADSLSGLRDSSLVFSQSSLQDYVDCARRFQLRYLEDCRWPAPQTEDALEFERFAQRGHAFHRLMRQVHSGIPAALLEPQAAQDGDVHRWWDNYQRSPPLGLPAGVREAEWMMSASVAGCRVEARCDLLAGELGQHWMIVDWKTGRHRTPRQWLAERLQTRVYPFILVEAGAGLNGGQAIRPEQVEMCYWFADFPAQAEHFAYSAELHASNDTYLTGLITEIEERADSLGTSRQTSEGMRGSSLFTKTEDKRRCKYCPYRSLCWDDVKAGTLAEAEELEGEETTLDDLDLESLAPIPY